MSVSRILDDLDPTMEQPTITGIAYNEYNMMKFYHVFDALQTQLSAGAREYEEGSTSAFVRNIVPGDGMNSGRDLLLSVNHFNDTADNVTSLMETEHSYESVSSPELLMTPELQECGEVMTDSEDEMLTVHFEPGAVSDGMYVCSVCNAIFDRVDHLKSHEFSHAEIRPYPCTICSYAAKTSKALREHMYTHADKKQFQCHVCDFSSIRQKKLTEHLQFHNEEHPCKCLYCSFSCPSPQLLSAHIRLHHKMQTQASSFRTPDTKLNSGNEVSQYNGDFLANVSPEVIDLTISDITEVASGAKSFTCGQCYIRFDTRSQLWRHSRLSHPETKEPFSCNVCHKQFTNHSYLMGHMRMHSSLITFLCDSCPQVFTSAHLFAQHQLAEHGRESQVPVTPNTSSNWRQTPQSLPGKPAAQTKLTTQKKRNSEPLSQLASESIKKNLNHDKSSVLLGKCYVLLERLNVKEIKDSLEKLNVKEIKDSPEKLNVKKTRSSENQNVTEMKESFFKCDSCNFFSLYSKGLKQHTSVKHGKRPEMSTPDDRWQIWRKSEVITPKGNAPVSRNQIFQTEGRHEHVISVKKTVYSCVCCSFRSKDVKELKKHLFACTKTLSL